MNAVVMNDRLASPLDFSPLAGEMAGRPEGVTSEGTANMQSAAEATPTGGFAATSPARGEGSAAHVIIAETAADVAAREALLDRAMGAGRKRKSSEKLRRGRRPSEGLAFVARGADGAVVGTVRLWDVRFAHSPLEGGEERSAGGREKANDLAFSATNARSESGGQGGSPEGVTSEGTAETQSTAAMTPTAAFGGTSPSRGEGALLLGPLAVDPSVKFAGIGSALMQHAIAEAKRLGHGAILLVGDALYYERFGFSAKKTGRLAMPGPYERHRFLALELTDGALDGAHGVLRPAGRKMRPQMELARAA